MNELTRENLGWLLAKASQRWNEQLAAGFRAAGFPEVRPSFGAVLVPLYEDDGLRMVDLARRSGLSKQAMTTLVRDVEAAGLVRRERDPADRRAFRVSLTPRARVLQPTAERVVQAIDDRLCADFSSAELDALRSALRKVVEL